MKDHVLFMDQVKSDSSTDCHERNISQGLTRTPLQVYCPREETVFGSL